MITIDKVGDFKTNAFARLLADNSNIKKILVVGCGDGTEVLSLNKFFPGSEVYGIDMKAKTLSERNCYIEEGIAENLRFSDNEFDLVYSFHVLEHVSDPVKAVAEMNRVLRKKGHLLIGTPNRQRLIGYISSANTTMMEKIRWNVTDWKAMIKGRFKNELGAHAGFSYLELRTILSKEFTNIKEVSQEYYEEIYGTKRSLVKWLYLTRVNRYLFPAVYFIAEK